MVGAEITRRLGATFDATGEAPRALREPRSWLRKLEERITAAVPNAKQIFIEPVAR